jgi:RNA polymerase sigma-70 factor (ECF subfamily)
MRNPSGDLTALLRQWSDGDPEAFDLLIPRVYQGLRAVAHHRLQDERRDHTLDTTALVNEAYLKLVDVRYARIADRTHFLSLASRAMRRILVDHARAKNAEKRGGGVAPVTFDEHVHSPSAFMDGLPELDEALDRLERLDERAVRAIEHRYFGGLTVQETSAVLDVSTATVKRDIRFARAWLARELEGRNGAAP